MEVDIKNEVALFKFPRKRTEPMILKSPADLLAAQILLELRELRKDVEEIKNVCSDIQTEGQYEMKKR